MKSVSKITLLLALLSVTKCQLSPHPSEWSDQKINEWFDSGEYLNGLQIIPDPSIDRRSFAVHYHDHKEIWDNAFAFLKNVDLANATVGRIELGGEMFAMVQEYFPRNRDSALLEVHQKYIDIQYLVSGIELIDLAPFEKMTVTEPYDSDNDIAFGVVAEYSELPASPESFFIFFPTDAHRPSLKTSVSDSVSIRKVVVKVPVVSQ